MKTRKAAGAKRLTRLVISEVSAVDRGAGEGVRIALIKRDGGAFDGAFGLIKSAGRKPKAKKAKRIKAAKAINLTPAPAPAPVIEEEHPIMTPIEKMSARCAEVMRENPGIKTTTSAIAKIAGSPLASDQQLWRDYKNDSFVTEHVVDPAPITKSVAYQTIEAKAAEFHKRHPELSPEQAFARIYEDPRNAGLRELDKAFHYSRLAGQTEVAEPAAARTAHQIVEDERQEHLRKAHGLDTALIDKAATADRLLENLLSALAAMYPQLGPAAIRGLARSLQQGAPDLPRLGNSRGYRGSAA